MNPHKTKSYPHRAGKRRTLAEPAWEGAPLFASDAAELQLHGVQDFLEDQRELVTRAPGGPEVAAETPEPFDVLLDGRMHPVHVRGLLGVLNAPPASEWLATKYGDEASRLERRYRAVIEFLDHNHESVRAAGFATQQGGDSLHVREELLAFLLDYCGSGDSTEIPAEALWQFVDEWGHRWV